MIHFWLVRCCSLFHGTTDCVYRSKALGATQSALVKREAEEGRAKNENQARKEVAKSAAEADIAESQARANAHVEKNTQKQRQNVSERVCIIA